MSNCGTNCEEALREIGRFLDGELDVDLTAAIQRHIGDCHPCGERAEFQRHLKVLIASKCATEHVPPELLERITALIREPAPPTA
jgi:mycothiol system anti-sigma-R factor